MISIRSVVIWLFVRGGWLHFSVKCDEVTMKRHTGRKQWMERLYNLRRDRRGTHERPHKPVLLLAIIHLMEREAVSTNEVRLTRELEDVFRQYFEIVRQGSDRATIENPFFHLCGDGFWQLSLDATDRVLYVPGEVSRAPTRRTLRKVIGRFDADFYQTLLSEPTSRQGLRDAIISRYFPRQRAALEAIAASPRNLAALREGGPQYQPERSSAFRRIVLELYDYRCAACGVRVKLSEDRCLVEAAHIIPFEVSRNDRPDNGLALCPNHHWAMDRFLIAPCPDARSKAGVWRVGPALDSRIDGQRDLVALDRRPVIPPSEAKFCPAPEGLRWREERLDGTG